MANPIRKFFQDLGRRLNLWNDQGVPNPPPSFNIQPEEPPSPQTPSAPDLQTPNHSGPPFLPGNGGSSAPHDNEVRWLPKTKNNPAHWEVGSHGQPPEIDAVRGMLRDHKTFHPNAEFVSVVIGGDQVKGDTGGLGGGPQHRGYVLQLDDLEDYLDRAEDMDDLANMIAPPGHGWEGAFKIGIKDD